MANIVCLDPRAKFNAYGWIKLPLLGLLYAGTGWKQLGHNVKIVCEAFGSVYNPLRHELSPWFVEKLREADVLAISVMTATAKRSYAIADAARAKVPRLWTITGGPHVSFREKEALGHCNAVVKGEGDSRLVLERALETSGVIHSPDLINLNDLPFPDFSLIDDYEPWLKGKPTATWRFWERSQRIFRRWVPLSTSRGCPQACSFCTVTQMYGRKYRSRDPENVIEEMEKRVTDGCIPHFFWCDDNIAANPKLAEKLIEGIYKRIIEELGCRNLKIVAEARADIARNENLLDLLQRAGCYWLFIGFESVNPETLRSFNKKQTVEEIRYCVIQLKKRKIGVQGMFIIGADDDTIETLKQIVRFAIATGMNSIQISILIPLPGTKDSERLEKEGRILTRDYSCYDGTVIVFQPEKMGLRELQEAFLMAWQDFYRRAGVKYWPAVAIGRHLWKKAHGAAFEKLARQFEG